MIDEKREELIVLGQHVDSHVDILDEMIEIQEQLGLKDDETIFDLDEVARRNNAAKIERMMFLWQQYKAHQEAIQLVDHDLARDYQGSKK